MKAKEFDEKFDRGEDVTRFLDRDRARRPGLEQKRVNVDFPVWMIKSLDREARPEGCDTAIHYQDVACGQTEGILQPGSL